MGTSDVTFAMPPLDLPSEFPYPALPPEINSFLLTLAGPDSAHATSWAGAASFWADFGLIVANEIANTIAVATNIKATWIGFAGDAIVKAFVQLTAWLTEMEAVADVYAGMCAGYKGLYHGNYAAMPPLPEIIGNDIATAAACGTNFMGVNSGTIAALRAWYAEMWAQAGAVNTEHHGASMALTQGSPIVPSSMYADLLAGAAADAGAEAAHTGGAVLAGLSGAVLDAASVEEDTMIGERLQNELEKAVKDSFEEAEEKVKNQHKIHFMDARTPPPQMQMMNMPGMPGFGFPGTPFGLPFGDPASSLAQSAGQLGSMAQGLSSSATGSNQNAGRLVSSSAHLESSNHGSTGRVGGIGFANCSIGSSGATGGATEIKGVGGSGSLATPGNLKSAAAPTSSGGSNSNSLNMAKKTEVKKERKLLDDIDAQGNLLEDEEELSAQELREVFVKYK